MYKIAFYSHVMVSVITLLVGIISLTLAIKGYRQKLEYGRFDRLLGTIFLIGMYFQMIVGLIMYYVSFRSEGFVESGPIEPGNSPNIRFWEIEHVAVMIFTLFLVQIACIFINKTKSSSRKFVLRSWYFGTALILMIFTMIMGMR